MIIGVVGAGAIGGFFGGKLKNAGQEVIFLARGTHLETMKAEGLRIQSENSSVKVKGTFTNDIKDLSECDLLLFTVKAIETKATAEKLLPILKENAYVLTLQNGVDNEEILAEVLGKERVLSGASYISAAIQSPGVITHSDKHLLVLGALDEANHTVVEEIVPLFKKAGVHCEISERIIARKWGKLLWNVTFNPLSAVTGATVGEILDDHKLREISEKLLQEAIKVSQALGVHIEQKVIDQVLPSAELVPHHKTSMLQDREKGRAMEVESLCGYIVQQAQRRQVDVPVLKTIYAALSFIDQKRC
jgi:2-dehydropantoate 2-reductase